MQSDKLYRIQKSDFPKLERLLTECFEDDPLYTKLITDKDERMRLMPELFKCDLTEYYNSCEMYSDSPELNSILVVSDEAEPYNHLQYLLDETIAGISSESYIIKEDPTLKTLKNVLLAKNYLNSKWTEDLHDDNRLHVIYLAVRPSMQHHGLVDRLMSETIKYSEEHNMMISLETHNEKNVDMYRHFGFRVFEVVEEHFDLKQYCLIRQALSDKAEIVEKAVNES